MKKESDAILLDISNVLDMGYRTPDIIQPEMKLVGTKEMGDLITSEIENLVTTDC